MFGYMGAMVNNDEQKEWADSVRILFPVFEGSGTHVNVSGVALTKYAPHKEDAIKLMEFLASEKAQGIYAEIVHEYPVMEGVARDVGLPVLYPDLGNREAELKLTDPEGDDSAAVHALYA